MLGLAQGVYWPQQSRFAQAWFAPQELTRVNSVIQHYGLYLALAIGFVVLTPIHDAFGWRFLFFLTGSLGFFIVAPLYAVVLKSEAEAPHAAQPGQQRQPSLDLEALDGPPFLLVVFSYVTQGMPFWGVTLWLPLAVQSLGFAGLRQACASALPYATAVLLAAPMSILADKAGKRVLIASLGMLVGGLLLLLFPFVNDNHAKLGLIALAVGYLASSYSPDIWSILRLTAKPQAVGPAVGIVNGLGAGGGATIAGFLVGMLNGYTGSYMPGFMVLGGLVVLGSLALLLYSRLSARASTTGGELAQIDPETRAAGVAVQVRPQRATLPLRPWSGQQPSSPPPTQPDRRRGPGFAKLGRGDRCCSSGMTAGHPVRGARLVASTTHQLDSAVQAGRFVVLAHYQDARKTGQAGELRRGKGTAAAIVVALCERMAADRPLCTGHAVADHLLGIDHLVVGGLVHLARLQRDFLERAAAPHRLLGDVRRVLVADRRAERRDQHDAPGDVGRDALLVQRDPEIGMKRLLHGVGHGCPVFGRFAGGHANARERHGRLPEEAGQWVDAGEADHLVAATIDQHGEAAVS